MAQGKDPVDGRPNGGRSREIAADIDRSRDALDRTVDAIVGKLTPSQLLMEAVHVFRSGSSSILGKVIEAAREHPVPATIVASGLGMMLWERSSPSGSSPTGYGYGYAYGTETGPGPVDRVREKAHEAKQGVVETLEGVTGTVQDKAQHAREAVRETLDGAKETGHVAKEAVREKLHDVKEAGQTARQAVREKVHDVKAEAGQLREAAHQHVKDAKIGFWQTMDRQPMIIGGIALAVGAATALLIPTTEKEGELMGEKRDQLLERVEEKGRQVLEKGREVARTAADVLKEQAREEGLAPDQLADKARKVARDVEEAALKKAEDEELVPAGVGAPSGGSGPGGSGSGGLPPGGGSTSRF